MLYKIMSSKIIDDINDSVNSLQTSINKMLNDGWIPQGGIAIAYDSCNGNTCALQAMVKKEE